MQCIKFDYELRTLNSYSKLTLISKVTKTIQLYQSPVPTPCISKRLKDFVSYPTPKFYPNI